MKVYFVGFKESVLKQKNILIYLVTSFSLKTKTIIYLVIICHNVIIVHSTETSYLSPNTQKKTHLKKGIKYRKKLYRLFRLPGKALGKMRLLDRDYFERGQIYPYTCALVKEQLLYAIR